MFRIFDYLYYRIYNFFENKNDTPQAYAVSIVSLLQFLIIIDILLASEILAHFFKGIVFFTGEVQKIWFLPVMVAVYIFNEIRYKKFAPVHELKNRWDGEPKAQRTREFWRNVSMFTLTIGLAIILSLLR